MTNFIAKLTTWNLVNVVIFTFSDVDMAKNIDRDAVHLQVDAKHSLVSLEQKAQMLLPLYCMV